MCGRERVSDEVARSESTAVHSMNPSTLRSRSWILACFPWSSGRPRQDSNLRSRLRRAVLYPLSYGGSRLHEDTSGEDETGLAGWPSSPPDGSPGHLRDVPESGD